MELKSCKKIRRYTISKEGIMYESIEVQQQNHETEAEGIRHGLLLKLPSHLICDILSRLPMKTIFGCRCVCKTFLEIVTDPYFAEVHYTRTTSTNHCLIFQKYLVAFKRSLACIGDLIEPSCLPSRYLDRAWRTLMVPFFVNENSMIKLVGSLNGLLCLRYLGEGRAFLSPSSTYYICNPILGEFTILPHCWSEIEQNVAFGFCRKTKQYKVIKFFDSKFHPCCLIHTLGADCWRAIEKSPPFPRANSTLDCSLNGNLHYITDSDSVANLIYLFNLETEQCTYIPPPTHFNQDYLQKMRFLRVSVLNGLLCVNYLDDGVKFEVFVMKEYGVKESWSKKLSIPIHSLCQHGPETPVKVLNNGDLLICSLGANSLLYYSHRTGNFRKVRTDIVARTCDVVVHAPSFVSLKDIVGGRDVKVVQ